MKFTTVTGTLIALSPLASAYGHAPQCNGPVHTASSCNTRYGPESVYKVPTGYAVTSKTVYPTVTVTAKASTCTVTGKDKTITKEVTSTCTKTKSCSVRTVYTTKVYTSTYIVVDKKYVTDYYTKTVAGGPHTVYPKYGFVNVNDDPDNKYKAYKREAYGNYNPKSYPTAVYCTKTLAKTCAAATVTKVPPKVTVTVPGKVKTAYVTKTETKWVCGNPTVTTKTVHSTCTVTSTKKTTLTKTVTKTKTLPGPTHYAACGSKNIYTGKTGSVTTNVEGTDKIVPAKNAYECCAQCQKSVSGYNQPNCAGSYFVANKSGNKCYLKITDKCPSQSCKHYFKSSPPQSYGSYGGSVGSVSNGVCGKWKWQKY